MFAAKNLVAFLLFFITFHNKVQLFCFLLKQFFENVKKKFTVGGGGVREGRCFFFFFFFFFSASFNFPLIIIMILI